MKQPWFILLFWITIISKSALLHCETVKILGPQCGGASDDKEETLNCGSSVQPNVEGGSIALGNLCSNGERLQIRILRDDVNIQGDFLVFLESWQIQI